MSDTDTWAFQTNHRTDEYSPTSMDGLKLLHRIVLRIREVVPPEFILGIKLNASDYVDSASESAGSSEPSPAMPAEKEDQEARALRHIRSLASWHAIDFIEVSGGDYENPGALIARAWQTKMAEFFLFRVYVTDYTFQIAPPGIFCTIF